MTLEENTPEKKKMLSEEAEKMMPKEEMLDKMANNSALAILFNALCKLSRSRLEH